MKRHLLTLLIVAGSLNAWSQKPVIGFQTGLEFCGMSDLTDINLTVKSTIPFDTKLLADFPGYWYYQPMFKIAFEKFSAGIEYSFNSTGSRLSGTDYSGEYLFDMRVRKKSPGLFAEYSFPSQKGISYRLVSGAGVMFSSLQIDENLIVNDIQIIDDSYGFRSINYYLQPGFKTIYAWNLFEFEINSTFLFQIGRGAFHRETDKNQLFVNQATGRPVKPGWTGFKIGISVNYIIGKSEPD